MNAASLPIDGISGYLHVISRLAQVKEKLQLITQYQLIPLQLLTEQLNIIPCNITFKKKGWSGSWGECYGVKLEICTSGTTSPSDPLTR